MARILYLSHDNPHPAGGIRVLYRHVEILNEAGLDAAVVHFTPGFRCTWFDSPAPVIHAHERLSLGEDDYVVVPEDHRRLMEGLRGVPTEKKVLFCQGHYQVFAALAPEESWQVFGFHRVMCVSRQSQDFIRHAFALEAHLVPNAINHDLFRPDVDAQQLAVVFMPRKGTHNLRIARGILWNHAPHLRKVPWVALEGMSETDVGKALRQYRVFLSTGYHEGFGLPPLEAMACGCIVIGFKAGGGRDFAHDGNGIWVEDEDPIALADALITTLNALIEEPAHPRWHALSSAAISTAAEYSFENQRNALLAFWQEQLRR